MRKAAPNTRQKLHITTNAIVIRTGGQYGSRDPGNRYELVTKLSKRHRRRIVASTRFVSSISKGGKEERTQKTGIWLVMFTQSLRLGFT